MRIPFCLVALLWGAVVQAAPVPDVRVAVDISGSMKQSDPQNLRRPALKLLTGLLPEGSQAGVWTFGQYVNMAVPWGRVTPAWKARARAEAARIHSRGRYTNIEEVIQKAAFNWRRPDPRYARHLVLLTDGKVDIARDAEVDELSRRRVLEELLPQLKAAGVKVHTVALSARVDRELLERLSATTGGWFAEAASAADLQRIFLQMFDKAAPRPSLPIEGNRFEVDAGVKEMTVVVFRRPDDPPLKIHPPDGKVFDEAHAPDAVSWYHEDTYDLVTVRRPATGTWRLATRSDPDNRVLVLTDLALEADPLPANLLVGDPLPVKAWLAEKGRPVKRRDFLDLVQFRMLDRHMPDAPPGEWKLADDGRAGDGKARDGIYGVVLRDTREAGEHELVIRADGATFQRERRHVFRILPALARLAVVASEGGFELSVQPEILLVEPDSVAVLREDTGEPLPRTGEHVWGLTLPASLAGQPFGVTVKARRLHGKTVAASYTVMLPGAMATHPAGEQSGHGSGVSAAEQHAPAVESENAHAAAPEDHGDDGSGAPVPEADHPDEAGETEGTDWTRILMLTLIINLVLAVAGLGGWLLWKRLRRRGQAQDELAMQL